MVKISRDMIMVDYHYHYYNQQFDDSKTMEACGDVDDAAKERTVAESKFKGCKSVDQCP